MKNEKLKMIIYEYLGKKYPEDIIEKTIPLIKERIKKLSDYLSLCEFFFSPPATYEVDLEKKKDLLGKIYESLKNFSNWKASEIGGKMMETAKVTQTKTGDFFMFLRVAITGKKISPPLNESMEILGKEECLERLKKII